MANYYCTGRPPKTGKRVELYMNIELYNRLETFVAYEQEHRDPFDDYPSRTHIIEKALDWYMDHIEDERKKKEKQLFEEHKKILSEADKQKKKTTD